MFKSQFEYIDWVEIDINGWHLKEEAPDYIVKAYEDYMKDDSIITEE